MLDIHRFTTDYIGKTQLSVQTRQMCRDYPTHWHEYYEVEYIISGHGIYVINDTEYSFSEHSLFFLTPLDFASMKKTGEDITLVNISFSNDWVYEDIVGQLSAPGFINAYSNSFYVRQIERLFPIYKNDKLMHMYIKSNLNCILYDIVKSSNYIAKPYIGHSDEIIRNAIYYIHMNFKTNPTLTETAEYVGVCPSYLSKQFHIQTGKTYVEYITTLKLEYARKLLKQTATGITDICYLCGFNSRSHFVKTFTKKYNIAPSDYRKINCK